MAEPKVFCIGFHKTGTTSLGVALEILGYRVRGAFGTKDPDIAKNILEKALILTERFDAFKDNPWPVLYREMDERYPGSKFLHVVRNTDSWLKSVVGDFGENDTPTRELIYGVGHPRGNEDVYVERYERHNAEVAEHFKDRPGDFLSLRLNDGEVTWENICPFLGKEIPEVRWPHVNTRRDKKFRMFLSRVRRKLGMPVKGMPPDPELPG